MNANCTPGEEVVRDAARNWSHSLGRGAVPTEALGGEWGRSGEEEAVRAVLAVPAYTHPPPLPFIGADRVPSPAR